MPKGHGDLGKRRRHHRSVVVMVMRKQALALDRRSPGVKSRMMFQNMRRAACRRHARGRDLYIMGWCVALSNTPSSPK